MPARDLCENEGSQVLSRPERRRLFSGCQLLMLPVSCNIIVFARTVKFVAKMVMQIMFVLAEPWSERVGAWLPLERNYFVGLACRTCPTNASVGAHVRRGS